MPNASEPAMGATRRESGDAAEQPRRITGMDSQKTIGALLFEGFELLDVFGPLEAWGMLASAGGWKIVTAAASAGAVASAQGPRAVADHSLAGCPKLDAILVPGGIGTRREVRNEALLEWLRRRSSEAEVVTSVCTGAALLARAGLLDGRRATSNKAAFGWVTEQVPLFSGSSRRAGSRTAHSSRPPESPRGST
jgi:putative intracellular protease/amidase